MYRKTHKDLEFTKRIQLTPQDAEFFELDEMSEYEIKFSVGYELIERLVYDSSGMTDTTGERAANVTFFSAEGVDVEFYVEDSDDYMDEVEKVMESMNFDWVYYYE